MLFSIVHFINSLLSVNVLPVLGGLLSSVAGLHGSGARSPRSGANFTVLVDVLESLDESKVFVNVSSDTSVVDRGVAKDLLVVDDESSSEG